jgi:hypothetical protein
VLGSTEKAIKIRAGSKGKPLEEFWIPITQLRKARTGTRFMLRYVYWTRRGLTRSGPSIERLLKIIADDGLPVNNLFQTEDNRWRANVRR